MPALKAVFFDLDDTLVLTSEHDKRAFRAVQERAAAEVAGLDVEALLAGFKRRFKKTPWDEEYKVEVTEWRAGLWAEALTEAAGTEQERAAAVGATLQEVFDSTRLSAFPFVEGVEELIAEIARRGLTPVIITNGHHKVQRDKLAACDAARLFEHIIVGGEEVLAGRPEKPAEGIFLKACELAQCAPAEALHVGDSLGTDVQGAINAGLKASVWVHPAAPAAPEPGPQPTFTVRVVTDLVQAVLDQLD